jgi:hypothetical protein
MLHILAQTFLTLGYPQGVDGLVEIVVVALSRLFCTYINELFVNGGPPKREYTNIPLYSPVQITLQHGELGSLLTSASGPSLTTHHLSNPSDLRC